MTSPSILFLDPEDKARHQTPEAPAFFRDLNLDQVVDAITAGKAEYHLKPFFYRSLNGIDAVQYRHEIFQDLECTTLWEHVGSFARQMRAMREHLARANKLYYQRQKQRLFLDAVDLYCHTVTCLAKDLSLADLHARGFLALRDHVTNYAASCGFRSLQTDTKKVQSDLSAVTYCLRIKGNGIQVRRYNAETDYSEAVEQTFAKFQQGAVKDYRVKFSTSPDMNHVEAQVVECVARLYPDLFSHLDDFCAQNANYLDETLAVFDREIQFYLAYLEYAATFQRAGLSFCYPQLSREKQVHHREAFDLALAHKLIGESGCVVCNDFYLQGKERTFVVSGPNQGGKTTFARSFGQLHHLAGTGCPVPGKEARLFLFDRLFTHFEREENIKNLRGKLQDDLVRIHDILNQASPVSILIMNEIFTSTTLQDAVALSKKVLEKVLALDALCVWVSFIDELASSGEQTVSLVSTIVPENPTLRTYKIIRKPADGLSYAMSIAEKYGLTYRCLKERLTS